MTTRFKLKHSGIKYGRTHHTGHVPETLNNLWQNYGTSRFGWKEFNEQVTGASSARANILQRLQQKGLIEQTEFKGPRGGKTWRITERGKNFLS